MWDSLGDFFSNVGSTVSDWFTSGDAANTLSAAASTIGNYASNAASSGYGDAPMSGLWGTATSTASSTPSWFNSLSDLAGKATTAGAATGAAGKIANLGSSLGTLAGSIKDVGSVYNLYDQTLGDTAAYQKQLRNLISNPNSITSDAAYQSILKSSNDAARRQAAASGMLNSGNLLNAIAQNTANQTSNYYNNRVNQLSNLAALNQAAITGKLGSGQAQLSNYSNLANTLAKLFG